MQTVSAGAAFRFVFSFLIERGADIVSRVALPAAIGWATFYAAFFLYLTEFRLYLVGPSERLASVVLGIASAGLLVTLFMHAVLTASATSLALGVPLPGWRYLHISRQEWRVYAAYLRYTAACAAFVVIVQVLLFAARMIGAEISIPVALIVVAGLFFLFVRIGLLIPVIAVSTEKGPILRTAWRLSRGHGGSLAAIAAVPLVGAAGIELLGEAIIRVFGFSLAGTASLVSIIDRYRAVLPQFLTVVAVAYLFASLVLSAASASVYRQISAEPAA